ncbi:MAG TPA: PadR family transcriptional regulator [Vicinamibacterales bacterium]|jgi:transcriptional regulator|nr:PadR family transcriptional regulator [Vicinamibacterales bacterium]
MPPRRPGVIQGTLDLLILRTLVFGPRHGHGIVKDIQAMSDDVLQVEHGSLYPALQRLEKAGCISAKWEETPGGREMKRYRLTPKGRRQLTVEQSKWQELAGAMTRLLTRAAGVPRK